MHHLLGDRPARDVEPGDLLDETQPILEAMPEHKRVYRLLGQSLARRLIAAHAGWLDEVRQTLAPREDNRPPSSETG